MKAWIGIAMLGSVLVCGTVALRAQEPKAATGAPAEDNMSPYRKLAGETLLAFEAHDMPTAKKKARELEVAWDEREKALEKSSPEVWGQIDKAMDVFIKPVMNDKSPDPVNVKAAHDAFVAKLRLAVKSAPEPKR
jgi:hypothetical protein